MSGIDLKSIGRIVDQMKSSRVKNYVLAGLDSYLLTNGNMRLFTCSRDTQDQITPHSHRFDFVCIVLEGWVVNRVWREVPEPIGDFFESSILTYKDEIGSHDLRPDGRSWYAYTDTKYKQGEMYAMTADEIHSIQFSRDAKVLFFEGPSVTNESVIIEPVVNGEKIPTYQKLDYMFIKE